MGECRARGVLRKPGRRHLGDRVINSYVSGDASEYHREDEFLVELGYLEGKPTIGEEP